MMVGVVLIFAVVGTGHWQYRKRNWRKRLLRKRQKKEICQSDAGEAGTGRKKQQRPKKNAGWACRIYGVTVTASSGRAYRESTV